MTMSTKLNDLVSLMAKEKGYAYTTGFLQSMIMEMSYGLRSKKLHEQVESDIDYQIRQLHKETV